MDIRAISVETEFLSLEKRWDLYTSAVNIIPESLLWSFTLRIYTKAFAKILPKSLHLVLQGEGVPTSHLQWIHPPYSSRKVTINIQHCSFNKSNNLFMILESTFLQRRSVCAFTRRGPITKTKGWPCTLVFVAVTASKH